MIECVVNISEGRDQSRLASLDRAGGISLRDRHSDPFHHRSVFTLINDEAALEADVRRLADTAIALIDLRTHTGVHPRIGVLDVVPFVALDPRRERVAIALRDRTARWLGHDRSVPTFLYGPLPSGEVRTLPEVRRRAFHDLAPDFGPTRASERTGACAVGQRGLLVAWNLWLKGASVIQAQELARQVRGPAVRALGLDLGAFTQVSCNLIDPLAVPPSTIYDQVSAALPAGVAIDRSELVGLAPEALLRREVPTRWAQLGLSETSTIEARVS